MGFYGFSKNDVFSYNGIFKEVDKQLSVVGNHPLMNSFFDIVKLDFLTNPTNRFSSSFVASMILYSKLVCFRKPF